jgi:hypothetical protein
MKDTIPTPHHRHEIYSKNLGVCENTPPLPLPPQHKCPVRINTYDDVDEPRWDPEIHLNLQMPEFVKVFPDFTNMKKTPAFKNDANGSRFAYSAPFQVFSDEGMDVLRKIIKREEKQGVPPSSARGNKIALRGLYYMSPFVRDLQTCPKLCEHFRQIAGEELVPHPSLCNSPQVNLSIEGATGPVDIWHYDSVAYTGVVLLSDVQSMVGGKLEFAHVDKHKGLDLLARGKPFKSEIIGYEQPGKMILAQGAELLHHVTPVTNNIIRISLIFGYAPANAFQPPKTILKTFQKVDQTLKMANYEFFREKAWQTMHCLKHYVDAVPYMQSGEVLGDKLRVVAQELMRAADLLQDKEDDSIKNFDESKNKICKNFDNIAPEHIQSRKFSDLSTELKNSQNGSNGHCTVTKYKVQVNGSNGHGSNGHIFNGVK